MVIFMLILLVLAIVIGVASSARRPPPPPLDRWPGTQPDDLSPSALAEADPLAALLRCGTPDDAARLGEQGVDLGGLGYRPPRDE